MKRTKEPRVTIVERTYNGGYNVSTIHGNQYYHSLYFGYTKRECVRMFWKELKQEGA